MTAFQWGKNLSSKPLHPRINSPHRKCFITWIYPVLQYARLLAYTDTQTEMHKVTQVLEATFLWNIRIYIRCAFWRL